MSFDIEAHDHRSSAAPDPGGSTSDPDRGSMNFNNHNIGPDHGPQPRTPPPAGVQQWSVKAVTRGPEHFERILPDIVIAADVNLAAEALCDRLAAPESPAERRYLIATVTPEFDAAATRDRLAWSNLLTWCADGWAMSQWLPDTWRRSCSPPPLPDQGLPLLGDDARAGRMPRLGRPGD